MTNTEGLIYVFIAIEVIAGLFGFFILTCVYVLFNSIKNRPFNLFILSIWMVLGWIYAMRGDAAMMLVMALFFGVPIAVLAPLAIRPFREENIASLSHIATCYLVVWAVSALYPYALVISGISMMPFIFWHTPISNGLVFGVAMLADIVIAAILFRFMELGYIPVST